MRIAIGSRTAANTFEYNGLFSILWYYRQIFTANIRLFDKIYIYLIQQLSIKHNYNSN